MGLIANCSTSEPQPERCGKAGAQIAFAIPAYDAVYD
jgi:hypothetical protein